eukprot:3610-Heterococcus_DN1.PRE.1
MSSMSYEAGNSTAGGRAAVAGALALAAANSQAQAAEFESLRDRPELRAAEDEVKALLRRAHGFAVSREALPALGSMHDSLMKGIRFAFTGDNSSSSAALESLFAPYCTLLHTAPDVSAAQTLLGCWQLLQAALEHLLRSVEADVVARGLKVHAAELDMSLTNAAAE